MRAPERMLFVVVEPVTAAAAVVEHAGVELSPLLLVEQRRAPVLFVLVQTRGNEEGVLSTAPASGMASPSGCSGCCGR